MTLPAAIAMALKTSPRMALARAGVKAAQAQKRSATAEGQPNLDLSVNGALQEPEVTLEVPEGPISPTKPPVFVEKLLSPTRVLDAELQALYPLFTGGRIAAGKRAAGRAVRAALARVQSEAQRLVLDVTAAYLNVLEAHRQAALAGAQRELNEERLRVARLRVRTGVAILQEATQVEADLAQTVQEEIEAVAVLGRSVATLNTLVGRRAYEPLVLVDLPETSPGHPVLAPATGPPSPEALRELGLDRPDLLALRQEVRQAEAQVRMARAARWPQINLFQNYLKRVPATLLGSFAWSLGASLVQSVFDGGRIRAQVAAARAERTRRRAAVEVAGLQVEEQVEQARVTLESAEARIEADERRVAAAAATLEVAQRRLRAGVAPPIEVTEAETVLARALTAASAARFAAARARVQLAFVAGMAYPDVVLGLAGLPSGSGE